MGRRALSESFLIRRGGAAIVFVLVLVVEGVLVWGSVILTRLAGGEVVLSVVMFGTSGVFVVDTGEKTTLRRDRRW